MKNAQALPISFEFFPPKTREGMHFLSEIAERLEKLTPTFFSVTYGANGSTHEGTIETVKMLQEKTHVPLSPHLSCIGSSREQIANLLVFYQTIGLKRLVTIRGDLLPGMENKGELKFADQLISCIRTLTDDYFHITVAAYPECHPQAKCARSDLLHLKKKAEIGANAAITQYFFNPDAYFYFMDQCTKEGIFIPIIPGIMPITQFAKLVRFSNVCGAEIPRWIYKRLESYQDDDASLKAFGFEVVYNLCEQLIAGGVPGLHFYTLNQFDAAFALVQALQGKPQLVRANGTQVL